MFAIAASKIEAIMTVKQIGATGFAPIDDTMVLGSAEFGFGGSRGL